MPKQLMYVSHKTNEVMTGREARKRYRKRYTADPKLKYFDVSYYAQDDVSTETIQGIACQRKGKIYTFTVPGWDECSIYGLRDTKRVIHGRLDPAVRNTLGIDQLRKGCAIGRTGRKDMIMDFTSIPLKGTEYLYTYHNSQQISGQTGLVGYLRADFGSSDHGFFHTWNEHRADYNTDEFKAEFYAVIDYFREKGRFLHKRRDMSNFCYEVGNTFEYANGREYGVRVDSAHYAFLMRLNPNKGEYNLYCHCYKKDWLDSHLERSEKGIRFIDSKYNDLFRIPDGGLIQIEYLNDKPKQYVCRFIDPYHVEIHSNLYHICEFAERMEHIGATYKPVEEQNIIVRRGRSGQIVHFDPRRGEEYI